MNITTNSIKVIKGTYKRYNGMYVGERLNSQIKQNRNILITRIAMSSEEVPIKGEFYKRNSKYHKKGEQKTKIIHHDYIEIYRNILEAWKAAKEYPTVSYGLTCTRRDVIVVDVDEEFKDLDQAETYIYSKCDLQPSYIIQNPTSKHIQFGFVLNNSIRTEQFDCFNALTKHAAMIYNSDKCFNGPACKNPYATFFFDTKITGKIYNTEDLEKAWNYKLTSPSNILIHNTNTNPNSHRNEGEDKWHNNFIKIGRNLIFKYFRENLKQYPIEDLESLAEETATLTQSKTGIAYTDKEEAIYQMKSILDWCNSKGWERFNNPKSIIGSFYGMKAREHSLEIRKGKKGDKIRKFREWMEIHCNEVDLSSSKHTKKGLLSKKEAAKLIGISYDEFRNYLKLVRLGEITVDNLSFSNILIHNTNTNQSEENKYETINKPRNNIEICREEQIYQRLAS